uniref:SpaA isopeptide-forming pilin-related protein n=1 Tax=Clostridium sp. TaxID=1506 RepID=UPI0026273F0F
MNIFRKSKRLFKTISMILAMLIVAPSFNVFAVEINHTSSTTYLKYHSLIDGKVKSIGKDRYYTSSNNIAYCLTVGAESPNGQDYTTEIPNDSGLEVMLYWGYPAKNGSQFGLTEDEYRYCTQLALWAYQREAKINRGIDRNRLRDGVVPVSKLKPAIDFLVNKAKNRELPTFFEINPNEVNASENGDYLVSDSIKIKSDYSFNDAKVTVKSTSDPNLKDKIKIVDMNGNERNKFSANESFRAYIPKNAKTGDMKISVKATVPIPSSLAYKTPVSGKQDMTVVPLKTMPKEKDNITVRWTGLTGNLKVIKKGDNGELLTGAKFQLKDNNGNIVAEKTTENGELTFTDIMENEYTLEEVESPKGFLKAEPVKVTIKAGETAEINVVDTQIKGRIQVLKVDEETGEPLEGASFDIVDKTNN